jgi:hypothetical protein
MVKEQTELNKAEQTDEIKTQLAMLESQIQEEQVRRKEWQEEN